MKNLISFLLIFSIISLGMITSGCAKKSPTEKLKEDCNKVVEDVGEIFK